MGFSKKKNKNFVKTKARVGGKAKGKAKKARQIGQRQDLRESKRRAAEATGKTRGKSTTGDDDLREIKSVDALFASVGDEDDDSDLIQPSGSDQDSDDESSAGAFHDVGDGDDDDEPGPVRGIVEELDEEEEGDAGLRHEQELKAIKEKDPEFYKFLVEQDRSLLNFQAPLDENEEQEAKDVGTAAVPDGDDDEVLQGDDLAGSGVAPAGKLLTRERLERVQSSAKGSWTACKAALNIYHTAVRSMKEQQVQEASSRKEDKAVGKAGKRKSKAADPSRRRGLFRIEDESIFSDVIEWSIANMLPLLRHHAGELRSSGSAGKKNKKSSTAPSGEAKNEAAAGLLDPTKFSRWSRVRVLANIFYEETLFLLNHLVAQNMLEYVLRHCSTPEALSWLWPFKPLRQRYVRRCCQLWSTAGAHNVRLLSFLLLRNSAAMILHTSDSGKGNSGGQQLEALLRSVVRSFADVASWGFSWKTLNTFRFMENCIVELLRLEDATAYRLGYVCLRQLALILRNASLAASHGTGTVAEGKSGGEKGKGKKKQVSAQQQAQALTSWPFVRAISLWTKAVGSVPSLRPLAFPLSMVVSGAMKHKLTSLQNFPFVYHCLISLNRLASSLECFIPISSHLLKALGLTLQAIESMHKKRPKGGEAQTLDSSVKAPDLEVSLRLSDAQLASSLCLDLVGEGLCFLFLDHLGLLSQSPAFPEMMSPVMLHLRKHSKHCKSEPLRKQLKALIDKVENTVVVVRARREALTEVPASKKFLVFDADVPIAKARVEVLKRRAAEERTRVQAELQEGTVDDSSKVNNAKPTDEDGKGKNNKRKEQSKVEERSKLPKKRKRGTSAIEVATAGGALPDKDKVEEMGFSSGAED